MIRKQCTRCGRCCAEEVCPVGEELFKTTKPPCPGLKWDNDMEICNLVNTASKDMAPKHGNGMTVCNLVNLVSEDMKPVLFLMMGFGVGCDASFKEKHNEQ